MALRPTAAARTTAAHRQTPAAQPVTLRWRGWLVSFAIVVFSFAATLLASTLLTSPTLISPGLTSPLLPAVGSVAQAQGAGPFLPDTPFDYEGVVLPDHFLTNAFEGVVFQNAAIDNDNTPASNPITNAGATLGRVLFFDKKLSANGTASCASCHRQANAFASPVTTGFAGETTRRHTMSLTNARFYERGRFFWDERAETLEDQVIQPFQDPIELGLTLDQLLDIIGTQPYYGPLFTDAFGDPEPTPDRIARALAQFVRSIVSFNSRYDQGRVQVSSPFLDFPNFSPLENAGKSLFLTTGCSSCHVSEAFVNLAEGPKNNGLPVAAEEDLGAFETFGAPELARSFKVPSLRNIEVTGPFMHDGRFATLEEVIEHYSSGVQHGDPTLSEILVEPEARRVANRFSPGQKAAFVAFLQTLTDEEALITERLSDPFIARPASATATEVQERSDDAAAPAQVTTDEPVSPNEPVSTDVMSTESSLDTTTDNTTAHDSTTDDSSNVPDAVLYAGMAVVLAGLALVVGRQVAT